MIEFVDDDRGYLIWLAENPEGYVINVRRSPDPAYVVLHRASCWTISTKRVASAYTGRGYRKLCALGSELRAAAVREGRPDGTFSKVCRLCQPTDEGNLD
jgi:hypothetical protein